MDSNYLIHVKAWYPPSWVLGLSVLECLLNPPVQMVPLLTICGESKISMSTRFSL